MKDGVEARNVAILRAYAQELWNEHDVAAVERYSCKDGVVHRFNNFEERFSITTMTSRVARILRMMPDHHMDIGYLIAQGETVVWSWTIRGNWHFESTPPRPVLVAGASVYGFNEEGLISWRSGESDALRLDYQLGRTKNNVSLKFPM